MINFFGIFGPSRPKKHPEVVRLNQNLSFAFSKLDTDIGNMQQWLQHLHNKGHVLESSHGSHVDVTRRDLDNLSRWVQHLYKHNVELQKYMKDLTTHLVALEKQDTAHTERMKSVEGQLEDLKGHVRTQKRTLKGQEEDTSSVKRTSPSLLPTNNLSTSVPLAKEVEVKADHIIAKSKSSLNGSQVELLNVFYEADRPLSYNDLAKILGKKNKSVRNLIYEIREKGIDIKSRFVGLRKKGFYLTNEQKIKLTGR